MYPRSGFLFCGLTTPYERVAGIGLKDTRSPRVLCILASRASNRLTIKSYDCTANGCAKLTDGYLLGSCGALNFHPYPESRLPGPGDVEPAAILSKARTAAALSDVRPRPPTLNIEFMDPLNTEVPALLVEENGKALRLPHPLPRERLLVLSSDLNRLPHRQLVSPIGFLFHSPALPPVIAQT